jgi:[protein-PII] uridylyltransferase
MRRTPEIIAALRSELAAIDAEPLEGARGLVLTRLRTEAVDRAVVELFRPFADDPGLSLAALGGYGRGHMTPGSDIDLLFLYGGAAEEGPVRAAVNSVLYPLWDAEFVVGHAVRTVEECSREAAAALASLTSLLDLRALAGDPRLVDRARDAARSLVEHEPAAFVKRLQTADGERERSFGRVAHRLEPDLKESAGGLRDLNSIGWMFRYADGGLPLDESDAWLHAAASKVEPKLDLLLLVRTALHRVTGTRTNTLSADVQDAVASALGIPDEGGWAPGDSLMRDIAVSGRWVWMMSRLMTAEVSFDSVQRLLGPGNRRPDDIGLPVWTAPVTSSFLELLAGEGSAHALELLDGLSVLHELIPELGEVRGRPQRDPYHRYPVDVHLFQATAEARRLLHEPDEPFASEAADQIADRDALVLGALLHDIGKVGTGSHVTEGMARAERVLDRMGIEGTLRDDVLFLVREHLLLSDTATRRNIHDEALVLHVAARIGTPERLAMLYLLSMADALATGPSACTPWRLGLIRELVANVSRAFEHGLMDQGRATQLERAEAVIRVAMQAEEPDQVTAFIESMPASYVSWVAPEDAASHLRLVAPQPEPHEIRTDVRPGRAPSTYSLTVACQDRPGLLASIAGALSLAGLSIVEAQAFTSEELALDVFTVRGAFEVDVDEERWSRFRANLRGALAGEIDLAARVREVGRHYRRAPEGIPVTVRFDDEGSDFFTLVEVGGPDRLGLLHDLARTFAVQGLDVHLAKVATYGPRIVDVFYVTDEMGERLADRGMRAALDRALRQAVSLV